MADNTYTFVIQDDSGYFSGKGVPTSAPKKPAVPTSAEDGFAQAAADGFFTKVEQTAINKLVISPLNQATNGLASPTYNLGKAIISGAGAGAIGGAAAMVATAALQLVINKLEARIAKMEAKADAANRHDNALLRGGLADIPTFYTSDVWSVHSTRQ